MISKAYKVAAWVMLAAALALWLPFVAASAGFYLGGFVLQREGL